MPNTMTLISSYTVGAGGASSIDFTSIPSTYTDLIVKFSARCATSGTGGVNVRMRFNSDTGSNYSTRRLVGNGSATASYNETTTSTIVGLAENQGDTANTFTNCEVLIPNYTSSNYKSVNSDSVHEMNGTTAYAYLSAGLWNSTSAISSIKLITSDASNFSQYSTAYLYGIVKQ